MYSKVERQLLLYTSYEVTIDELMRRMKSIIARIGILNCFLMYQNGQECVIMKF